MSSKPNRRSAGFTLVELLVVIAVIGILIGMLVPAVQRVREAANRTACLNNLRNVAIASHTYQSSHQRLPAGSSPELYDNMGNALGGGFGVMMYLLPHLDQQNLYESGNAEILRNSTNYTTAQIDSAFGSLANDHRIEQLLCPSSTTEGERASTGDANFEGYTSHYVGITGPGLDRTAQDVNGDGDVTDEVDYATVYSFTDTVASGGTGYGGGPYGEDVSAAPGPLGLAGAFSPRVANNNNIAYSPRQAPSYDDISDGASTTFIFGEVSREEAPITTTGALGTSAWIYGAKYEVATLPNGAATRIPTETHCAKSLAIGINSQHTDGNWRNCHVLGSNHPGGALFARADGTALFVSETIDIAILNAVSSIESDEVIDYEF